MVDSNLALYSRKPMYSSKKPQGLRVMTTKDGHVNLGTPHTSPLTAKPPTSPKPLGAAGDGPLGGYSFPDATFGSPYESPLTPKPHGEPYESPSTPKPISHTSSALPGTAGGDSAH